MKNLLDKPTAEEVLSRIERICATTTPLWGKMNAGQMMAHCQIPIKVGLGETKPERTLVGIIFGWWVKRMILSEKPFKKGLPTDKSFLITDDRDFDKEKNHLTKLVARFQAEQNRIGKAPHPFFGKMTASECGTSMYKHLDHHLQQFGV